MPAPRSLPGRVTNAGGATGRRFVRDGRGPLALESACLDRPLIALCIAGGSFHGIGLIGAMTRDRPRSVVLKIPSVFPLVNLSILTAWFKYLSGELLPAWEPSCR